MAMAKRLKGMGSAKYQNDGDPRTSGPGFLATEHESELDAPLHWRKPAKVFVNSMSDLFHDDVPVDFIARVWAVMATAAAHTFQILTKRHGRMRSLLNSPDFRDLVAEHWKRTMVQPPSREQHLFGTWPLRNVWLGVSVEDQKWADIRIPALLDTPAAVRFLSCEPLLGPVTLRTEWMWATRGVHWLIVGGESGPGARPMHPNWARSLRDQCVAAGVPFLMKQWGEWLPLRGHREYLVLPPARSNRDWSRPFGDDVTMCRVGKKAAGRELDGRTWDEFPEPHRVEVPNA